MKNTRFGAAVVVAAAALMTLSGCFQLPGSAPTGPSAETQPSAGTSDGGTTGDSVNLVDTEWSGTDEAGNEMTMTLQADGTVLLENWNGESWDEASDTWSIVGDQVTIFISGIRDIQSLTYTGTASLGSMTLTGIDGLGDSGYDVTLAQQ